MPERVSPIPPRRDALEARLDRLLASDPAAMGEAREIWRELAARGPTQRHGTSLLVLRYADAKRVLRDTQEFGYVHVGQGRSVDEITAGYTPEQVEAFHEVAAFERNYMNRSGDGETHARLRRIAHRAFTPRRVEELRDAARHATGRLLDEAAAAAGPAGQADLAPLAFTLPLVLICDMLGVPKADRGLVHAWSGRLGRNRGGVEPGPLVDARDAMREFRAYVEAMLDDHRSGRSVAPPLVEALVGAEHEERLTPLELTATFVILLFAGHETTTNLLSIGLVDLLESPAAWRQLCDDPGLVPAATDELLRHVTPVQFLARQALRDTELGGTVVPAGQVVMPVLAAANRDAAVFPDPDVLDLRRPNARDHLAFGFGLHFCLGSALARLEGEVALAELARRFPDLALAADPRELEWCGHAMLRRIAAVPVRLGVDRGSAG